MIGAGWFERAQVFLPPYLSPDQKKSLFADVRAFPDNKPFYLIERENDKILQGDSWRGFDVIEFRTGDRKQVTGIILSNSCDIAVENETHRRRNIVFCPIIQLERYKSLLEASGRRQDKIDQEIVTIREQCISGIFFLPKYGESFPESIVMLDDVHTQPLDHFLERPPKKLLTLSMFGFYLFLMKLSIHFCRMQEAVSRFDDEPECA